MDQAHQAALRKAADGDLRMSLLLACAITAAQVMLGLAMGCAAYRILSGPRAHDRVLGLDTFYVCALLMLYTYGVQTVIGRATCGQRVCLSVSISGVAVY